MSAISIDKKSTIKWILCFLLPILILLIPTNEAFTGQIRLFLAITLWSVLLFIFELVDTAVAGVSVMFLYCFFGILTFQQAVGAWANTTIWMVFGCLILINAMQRTNVLKRIAYNLLILTGGTYMGIIMGLTIFGVLFGTISIACVALAFGVCKALNLGKGKAAAGILLATTVAVTSSGDFIFTAVGVGISGAVANLALTAMNLPNVPVDYVHTFLHNIPWVAYPFITSFILAKLCAPKENIGGKEHFRKLKAELGPMSGAEKKALAIFIAVMVYAFTTVIHGLDLVYGFIFGPMLLFFPGFKIGTKEDITSVNIGMLMFIAGCISIGTAATAVGIGDLIAEIATPVLANRSGGFFVFLTLLLGALANIVMTPVALMSVLAVPLSQIAVNMDMTVYPVIYALKHACTTIIFPYENTTFLFAYAFGLIDMKLFMKLMAIMCLAEFIFMLCVGVPFWTFLGLM